MEKSERHGQDTSIIQWSKTKQDDQKWQHPELWNYRISVLTSWFPSSSSVSEQLERYWLPDHSSSPSQISRDCDIPGQPARQCAAQVGGTPAPAKHALKEGEGSILLWGLFCGDRSPLSSITGLVRSESFSSELIEALCCFLNDKKKKKSILVLHYEWTQTPRGFVKQGQK